MARWITKLFRIRGVLFAGLLLAAIVSFGSRAMAQSPGSLQALYDRAAAVGSIRIIVSTGFPRLPDRGLMAPQDFDSILSDLVHVAQLRVIEALPPTTVIKDPVRFPFTPQFVVTVTEEGLAALAANPDVMALAEDVPEFPLLDQSVPHIFPGHAASPYTGNGWTVAILDTGVDKNHSFLSGKVVAEACYSTTGPSISTSVCPGGASSSTAPDSGLPCSSSVSGCDHGTHVAGIAAGSGSDFDGIARNADLIAVQVFSRFDSPAYCVSLPAPCALTYISDQILGLQRVYALRTTYAIASVNMSLGGTDKYMVFCDGDSRKATIDLLKDAGIATVIASGNSGYTDGVSAPGCVSSAITVGATNDAEDTRAWFSNSGPQIDLYAPGLSIYSSVPGGGYTSKGGTSMATPHAAGAWAVLKEKHPTETVDEIEGRFDSAGVTVTSLDISRQRINIDEALGGTGFGFVPVAPCRIVDTRIAGGMVSAGTVRNFKVYGDNSAIQGQGGTGDCGISWTSKAVVLNITSTGAAGTGHFRLYPYGFPVPEAGILYIPAGLTIANTTISGICQPSCLNDIAMYSNTDSHVVIDVMGYME